MFTRAPAISFMLCTTIAAISCGDDELDPRDAGMDSGRPDAGQGGGGRGGSGGRGGKAGTGGAGGAGGVGGAGDTDGEVQRGAYLVNVVAACDDCHTPRKPDGSFDFDRKLSGVDCFIDADPGDDDFGCLSSRNLTNHETGLKNRSDQEIEDMLLKGERPADSGGRVSALHPVMPYWVLANMRKADADAIVAYLRTVAPVEHRTKPRQPPFEVETPAPAYPRDKIPEPRSSYGQRDAALRGRYLAAEIGVCLECHTPRDDQNQIIPERAFQGGRVFTRAELGLPPSIPAEIHTSNLTPHATGLQGWTVGDIVKALQRGTDNEGSMLCPPMPSGPMGAFAGLTDADAQDIAHYLLSINPAENSVPNCAVAPPDGDLDAGIERDD